MLFDIIQEQFCMKIYVCNINTLWSINYEHFAKGDCANIILYTNWCTKICCCFLTTKNHILLWFNWKHHKLFLNKVSVEIYVWLTLFDITLMRLHLFLTRQLRLHRWVHIHSYFQNSNSCQLQILLLQIKHECVFKTD